MVPDDNAPDLGWGRLSEGAGDRGGDIDMSLKRVTIRTPRTVEGLIGTFVVSLLIAVVMGLVLVGWGHPAFSLVVGLTETLIFFGLLWLAISGII